MQNKGKDVYLVGGSEEGCGWTLTVLINAETTKFSGRFNFPIIDKLKKAFRETLEKTGKCLACEFKNKPEKDQLGQKLFIEERTVFENDNWLCLVALAAESKGHLRLIPKKHRANLSELTEKEIEDLAEVLLKANKLMYEYNGKRLERNVLIREDYSSEKKMHMIIDILPIRKHAGGSSLSDLAVSAERPEKVASEMKKYRKVNK